MGTGNDEAKRLILARRARFVAAALAGIAAACGGSTDDTDPKPCLSIQPGDGGPPTDSASDAEPQPCLEPLPPDASDDAEPQPCLSPLPPDAGDGG